MVGRFKCPTRARGKYHISSPGKRRERVRKREKHATQRGEKKKERKEAEQKTERPMASQ
jgi:hypothetical protein